MTWRPMLLGVSVLLNLVLVYSLIWGENGAFEYKLLKEQCGALETKIQEYDEKNLALSKEIRLLQSDEKYQEKMIRTRLNFVRDNEILYIFPETKAPEVAEEGHHETEN